MEVTQEMFDAATESLKSYIQRKIKLGQKVCVDEPPYNIDKRTQTLLSNIRCVLSVNKMKMRIFYLPAQNRWKQAKA